MLQWGKLAHRPGISFFPSSERPIKTVLLGLTIPPSKQASSGAYHWRICCPQLNALGASRMKIGG